VFALRHRQLGGIHGQLRGAFMLDREKIVAVLKKRFAGAGSEQIAAAANAIVGLEDEWEELTHAGANPCSESCYLARPVHDFKVLRRRTTS
jgi:hypothetical protein